MLVLRDEESFSGKVQQPLRKVHIIEGQLKGIHCVSCRKKIVDSLNKFRSVVNVEVDVIAERALISLTDLKDTELITERITQLGFKVLGQFTEVQLTQDALSRTIYFQTTRSIDQQEKLQIIHKLKAVFPAILKETFNQNRLAIEYNPRGSKSSQMYEYIKKEYSGTLKESDAYLEGFRKSSDTLEGVKLNKLLWALATISIFFVCSNILPLVDWFQEFALFPASFGVLSLYVITMLVLSISTMIIFGRETFHNAYSNLVKFKILNMESLVSIGCVSSLLMTFWMIATCVIEEASANQGTSSSGQSMDMSHSNKLEMSSNDFEHRLAMVEELVHMMETASLILAIITLGKYQEWKAKRSIATMAEKVFVADSLLQNEEVQKIDIKNKRFDILAKSIVPASYVDCDDMLLVQAPFRLLHDVTLLHVINKPNTTLRIVDQIAFGQNLPFEPSVGSVIRSGAEILEGSGFVVVNHAIEQSQLYLTCKQLDLAKNTSECQQSGMSVILEKVSEIFIKTILSIAVITLVVWIVLIYSEVFTPSQTCVWCYPFERFVSVLVASCPCAIGLAIPSVLASSLNLAMKNSILIKKNSVFEKINRIKTVIFDKTGTLFTNSATIETFKNLAQEKLSDEQLWSVIQVVERNVAHPLAELLYKEAVQRGCNIVQSEYSVLDNSRIVSPQGIEGIVVQEHNNEGEKNKETLNQIHLRIVLGNVKLMKQNKISISEKVEEQIQEAQQSGSTVILLGVDGQLCGLVTLHNTTNLRPEAREVVNCLQKNLKKEVYILSGDHKDTVLEVGKYLNIPEKNLIGECEASMKKALIKRLREVERKEVMMVGDGLNDILSLEEASLGVSINAKSELNLIASDIVILQENLWNIPVIFEIVRISRLFIYINLIWAFAYNFFMIPVAAGCFCSLGLKISPLFSTSAMSLSSVIVVLFSTLIRCKDFKMPKQNKKSQQQQPKLHKGNLIELSQTEVFSTSKESSTDLSILVT